MVEEHAQRLARLRQGAAATYQAGVGQLELALAEAREQLGRAVEGKQQGQLRLRQLQHELAALKSRQESLQEALARRWQQQHNDAGQLQLTIESLEEEKQSLRVQIAQVLEECQRLMHLKMSLSLEVATYRTLLETESTRLQIPTSDFKLASSLRDGKLELSNGLSLDGGHLGPRDTWLSPKASAKPQAPRGQKESSGGNFTSSVPRKSRSPLARDFQNASTILPDPPVISFEDPVPAKEGLALANLPAFQPTEVWGPPQIPAVSQPLLHECLPPSDAAAPGTLEESSLGTEQSLQANRDMMGGRETEAGEKAGLWVEEEEEEEEEQEVECLSKEPAGEVAIQNGPYPGQLVVTEAPEIALKVVNAGGVWPDPNILEDSESLNGLPLDSFPPLEDEGRANLSPSTKLGQESAANVPKEPTGDTLPAADLLGGTRDSEAAPSDLLREAPTEANSSPGEVCAEQPEGETQGALAAESPTPQETRWLEEEEGVRETADGKVEAYHEVMPPGEEDEEPPVPGSNEEAPEVPEGAGALGKDVAGTGRMSKESGGSGSPLAEQAGASGGDLEEAEDLEGLSIEALHLSEGEESGELRSPSQKDQEGKDFQALEGELLQAEEFAACENGAPLSHRAAERGAEQPLLQLEQAEVQAPGAPREEMKLALWEGEVGEEPDAFPAEETPLAEEEGENLEEEPRIVGSARDAKGGKGEGGEDVARSPREAGSRDEDATEKPGLPDTGPACSPEVEVAWQGKGVPGQGELCKAEEQSMAEDTPEEQGQLAEKEGGAGKGGEEIPVAAPEGETQEEGLMLGPEASMAEREEEEAGILESEDTAGPLETENLSWGPEDERQDEADAQAEEEEQTVASLEEVLQSQLAAHLGESQPPPAEKEVEDPSEGQGSPTEAPEGKDQADTSSCQLQSESFSSEVSLESWDCSPNEAEGVEKGLASGKVVLLEETLPDHTPLHLYERQRLAASGELQQMPPESPEAAELPLVAQDGPMSLEEVQRPLTEEESLHAPPEEEAIDKQESAEEEAGCGPEATPTDDPTEKPTVGALELIRRDGSLVEEASEVLSGEEVAKDSAQLDPGAEKELAGGEVPQKGSEAEEEAESAEQVWEEELGQASFAWGPVEDSSSQVERLDASTSEESAFGEGDGPLELGDQRDTEAEGGHKVSPLTSVADLGEIVLEEEEGGDLTGSEAPVCGRDEDLPCAQEAMEDQAPEEEEEAEGGPRGENRPAEAGASCSRESMKDTDILEIVEQALEFNQELIKAAEPCLGAEATGTGGEEDPSLENEEEESQAPPMALPDVGDCQVPPEAPEISFPDAKDPTGSAPLWAEGKAKGLQQDPGIADFTEEIPNGIEVLQPVETECNGGISKEEPMKKVTITQLDEPPMVEETADQRPPQVLLHEEMPRIKDVEPEVHEKVLMEHSKGLEATDPEETLFADILQAACIKGGQGTDSRATSAPPHFEDEVLRLESNQHLNFRTEEEEEEQRWFSGDN